MQVTREDTLIRLPSGDYATLHSVELSLGGEHIGKSGGEGVQAVLPPLVFLPGFGTGAAIFAPAWGRLLASGFLGPGGVLGRRRLIAVDPLGWYLSSRPEWSAAMNADLAEDWFVQSLEAWRAERGFEVIDLLGHSIGGNIAASYAEKHPERVNVLVLLSPAGTPGEPEDYKEKLRGAPWRMRLMLRLWGGGWTPQDALRRIPQRYGMRISRWNAERWTWAISDGGEIAIDKDALTDYIYYGWTEGPPSGEYAFSALLHPGAWGKRPLKERIPKLGVHRVELIYGDRDWMDARHGNAVAEACEEAAEDAPPRSAPPPAVWVQLVPHAGHYAHLENALGFGDALAKALRPRPMDETPRTAEIPPEFSERYKGPGVPAWRAWEGYEFGR